MLLFFYGRECSHCHAMFPLVEKLEKEIEVKVKKYEIWHNEENVKKLSEYNQDFCNGVPFFFNTETKNYICGAVSYGALKNWAKIL